MGHLPLSRYRVIDATQNVAGPFCAQILADLGADVIKIEPTSGDSTRQWAPPYWEKESTMFMSFNRNKRSIALDLKREEGRAILDALLANADVFLQALRPSTARRLKLDAETLKLAHPEILVCELTAFGIQGPLADEPGYDPLMQSFSGLVSILGHEGAPPVRVATSIIDMGAGMWAAIGITSALLDRAMGKKDAVGIVHTSLFETSLAWLPYHILGFLATGQPPRRWGSELAVLVPYGAYRTADRPIMIAVGSEKLWRAFCDAIARPDLANDERFATNPVRVQHRNELRLIIEEVLLEGKADIWVERLAGRGIPVTPVNSIPDVLKHPQSEASGMLQSGLLKDDFPLVGIPLSIDGRRPVPRMPPPKLGQHTKEILAGELELSEQEITRLESEGVIGTSI